MGRGGFLRSGGRTGLAHGDAGARRRGSCGHQGHRHSGRGRGRGCILGDEQVRHPRRRNGLGRQVHRGINTGGLSPIFELVQSEARGVAFVFKYSLHLLRRLLCAHDSGQILHSRRFQCPLLWGRSEEAGWTLAWRRRRRSWRERGYRGWGRVSESDQYLRVEAERQRQRRWFRSFRETWTTPWRSETPQTRDQGSTARTRSSGGAPVEKEEEWRRAGRHRRGPDIRKYGGCWRRVQTI